VSIVNPLDGTKEFLAQNGEFSVMIGLAFRGRPVLGVVYLPEQDILVRAEIGAGSWMECGSHTAPLTCRLAADAPLRMIDSRSHVEPLVEEISRRLGSASVTNCGSVGVKCSRIARGEHDVYVHPTPYLKEWDTCAPEVIVAEAGG
jgi:3'(2'), 5'-bisphosphate nucleotidase